MKRLARLAVTILIIAALPGCPNVNVGGDDVPRLELNPPPGTYTEPVHIDFRTNSGRIYVMYSADPDATLQEFERVDGSLLINQSATFRYYALTNTGLRSPAATATYTIERSGSIPPAISDPYLRIASQSPASFTVNWTPAYDAYAPNDDSDDGSAANGRTEPSGISYAVFTSAQDNVSVLDDVLANGTQVTEWEPDIFQAEIPFAENDEPVFVNVLARSSEEAVSAYLPITVTRPELIDLYFAVDTSVDGGTDRIARNYGDGAFAFKDAYSGVWPYTTQAVVLSDLDSDGDDDLIVAHSVDAVDSQFIREIYLNLGGSFDAAIPIGSADATYWEALLVADFDADGAPEIVTAASAGSWVHEFDPATQSMSTGAALPAGAIRLAAGDYNGDGLLDLATANPGDVRVLLNNGTQAGPGSTPLVDSAQSWGAVANAVDVAAGDFNGDHIDDLVVAVGGGVPGVFFGDSSGTLGEATTFDLWNVMATAIAVGDLNGDGSPELVLGTVADDGIFGADWDADFGELYFYELARTPAAWLTADVAIADLNGDGLPDIIDVVSFTDPATADKRAQLFLNEGGLWFSDPLLIGSSGGYRRVATGRIY